MVQSQFSLSWDAYKSNICGGFSSLQQNGEFVDMTLAADGHFVKVHQVLMALVSPYMKELITSAPCQHPVIFLNNVSHKTLGSLLEYIYTGEVLVPSESLTSFVETAKSLHIKGLEDVINDEGMEYKMVDSLSQMENNDFCHISGIRTLELPKESGAGQIHLPAAAKKVFVKQEKTNTGLRKKQKTTMSMQQSEDNHDYSDMMDESGAQDSDDDCGLNSSKTTANIVDDKDAASSNLQYSISIRGSLQVILNRYIYNLHSTTHRSGVRRWRCVEYRNHRCMAFLVTKDNVVMNRANLHNHPFHDKKILQKIEKKAVFSALDDVQTYKEKESEKESDADTSLDQQAFVSIDFTDEMTADDKKEMEM